LGVLASGGHTHLYWIRSAVDFEELGQTLDDAAGEAFDKIGQAINLPYPAGARIDELAKDGTATFDLPRPFTDNDNLDFSFSGLKTAAIKLAREKLETKRDIHNFCASLNEAIADTLTIKTERAARTRKPAAIWLAGGVAANSRIRQKLGELAASLGIPFLAPEKKHCQDNAAMIAYNGWEIARRGLAHKLDLEAIPRGARMPDDSRGVICLDSERP
ncbi:MAG: tRNA (adenosine(37)-N6)-threonylcarbamoyltransferase complex transferase subunit TsaD, partial [Desulfovibrio sp.]|nr:tRNA (adenosine(37)-N6)-threonylcarbamoyltransferase complex transferase subunit TsaD [Desulfovibrio sp.]